MKIKSMILLIAFFIIITLGFIITNIDKNQNLIHFGTYTCELENNQNDDGEYRACKTYLILKEEKIFYLYNLQGSVLRYGRFDFMENNMIRLEFLDDSEIEIIKFDQDGTFSYRCEMEDNIYEYFEFSLADTFEFYSGEEVYEFYNNLEIDSIE